MDKLNDWRREMDGGHPKKDGVPTFEWKAVPGKTIAFKNFFLPFRFEDVGAKGITTALFIFLRHASK